MDGEAWTGLDGWMEGWIGAGRWIDEQMDGWMEVEVCMSCSCMWIYTSTYLRIFGDGWMDGCCVGILFQLIKLVTEFFLFCLGPLSCFMFVSSEPLAFMFLSVSSSLLCAISLS